MGQQTTKKFARVGAAVVFGSLFGLAMGYSVKELMNPQSRLPDAQPEQEQEAVAETGAMPSASEVTTGNSAAMQYAAALQNGDMDRAVDMTRWMQERLAYVRGQSGSPETTVTARQSLMEQLNDRRVEENRLYEEGIEDQYVFAPGVLLEAVGVDAGAADLAEPVGSRTWIRARFPSRRTAPRDGEDVPIRAITVGVNVSKDGYILKANVIGNLEIDVDSISYDWTSVGGE